MLILPWPPSILRPNDRSHWGKKNPAKVKYKQDCYLLSSQFKGQVPEGHIPLVISFFPPNNRWDWDAMVSAAKAGFDGMADAWGVNDKRFKPQVFFHQSDKNNPRIEVTINV